MSTKKNHRRGHPKIQDGGPHGRERKRWAVGRSKGKRNVARKLRSRERDALATGQPLPDPTKRMRRRERWR